MSTACPHKERNLQHCTCTYDPCSRKGICCECILYHQKMKELPGCLFTKEGERTYNRSVQQFIRSQKG